MDAADLAPTLPALAGFLILLLLLAWLSRQISIYLQIAIYLLTRSHHAATLGLFVAFLPGVILHESAHWLAAKLLGLKTGKFRIWPKLRGKTIGLGSVSVESKGAFVDSLVGLAPLLAGSLLVGLIGQQIFNARDMTALVARGEWMAASAVFRAALSAPDGALWAYLLFTIANAMMPSSSDRQPLKPVLIYAGVAVAGYLVLGMPLDPITAALSHIAPGLRSLTSALFFTILLDLLILIPLYLIRLLVQR